MRFARKRSPAWRIDAAVVGFLIEPESIGLCELLVKVPGFVDKLDPTRPSRRLYYVDSVNCSPYEILAQF